MESLVNAIYFDTSILRQNPFDGLKRALKPLLDARERFPFDAWVPELAVREWTHQLACVLNDRVANLAKAGRELQKHDPGFTLKYTPPWGADSLTHAHGLLESELRDVGIAVVPTPDILLSKLIDMSILKTPPFDAAGRGFRDAVILETILRHAQENYRTVLLLAADKDFADSALEGISTSSGVLIRRARDVKHATQLISEKFFDSLQSMVRQAQEEVLPILRHRREEVLGYIRANLHPSEELLKGGEGEAKNFFWSIQRIDRILGYQLGDFGVGDDFPPFLDAPRDGQRIYVEMVVHVDFELLVSYPLSIDKPRFTLPDSEDGTKTSSEFSWNSKEISVARQVPFVVSVTRDEQGHIGDLRVEQCDGRPVK